jgi:alpha-beta hydrolase superfamily lysophospholipase
MFETPLNLEGSTKLAAVAFEGHAGTLHLPPPGRPLRAVVVIVPPLGRDRIWTYRSLFEWANLLASHGYAVLRYDPRDEGDSLFLAAGEELVTKWLEGVEQASRFARQMCRDRPLILSGLRIGATFALWQVENVKPAALVLWDPLPSGQHWVRELKLASVMVRETHTRTDGIEVNGLHLPPESLAHLERLRLPAGTDLWSPVLLSSPSAAKLLKPRLGPRVDQIAFTGYTDLFKDSHVNQIPWQLFSDTLDWLNLRLPERRSLPAPALPSAILSGEKWYEKRVELGQGLIGVLSLPRDYVPRRGVIFGNTSANPRAGDGNFTTRACRELAAHNLAALRIDFSGYGESPARAPDDLHVYETSRTEELNEAARFLSSLGVTTVAVAGVCTGGYHAFRALIESGEIDQALPINAWLHWTPGTQLDRAEHVNAIRSVYLKVPAQIRQHLRFRHRMRASIMPKLAFIKSILRRGKAVMTLRTELQDVLRRHKKLDLIMWSEDRAVQGIEYLGPSWLRTQAGASLSLLPDIDHAVVGQHCQAKVISELLRLLGLEPAQERSLVDKQRRASSL